MVGFINIYKPKGITSFSVVNQIKKQFNIKKIGHMGTLDPMACGVLPIAIGKATRLFDYSLKKDKTYNVIFEFGYTTDTLDADGIEIEKSGIIPSLDDVLIAIKKMIGVYSQLPPNFSAKRVNGVRAYDLARQGIQVELKPKDIEIYSFDFIEQIDKTKFRFLIKCSSGTYIRSIGRDLAEMLGTKACMIYLERVTSGNFTKDTSIELDKLLNCKLEEYIISPLQVFDKFDKINIDEKTYKDLLYGKKIEKIVYSDTFILVNNKIIAIAKADDKYLKLSTYLEE